MDRCSQCKGTDQEANVQYVCCTKLTPVLTWLSVSRGTDPSRPRKFTWLSTPTASPNCFSIGRTETAWPLLGKSCTLVPCLGGNSGCFQGLKPSWQGASGHWASKAPCCDSPLRRWGSPALHLIRSTEHRTPSHRRPNAAARSAAGRCSTAPCPCRDPLGAALPCAASPGNLEHPREPPKLRQLCCFQESLHS